MDVSEMFLCAMVLVLTWMLELDADADAEPCLMEVSFVRMYFTGGNFAAMDVAMGIIVYID